MTTDALALKTATGRSHHPRPDRAAAEVGGRPPVVSAGMLPRMLQHSWSVELLVLGVTGLVLPVAIAAHYGSLAAPTSDDWAYDLSAYHLALHGSFDLYHWGTIDLVGQLVLAAPVIWIFGPHAWVLNLWTCVIGTCGLLAISYLGRALALPRRQALFVAVLVGAGPMWAMLSTSFMTDVQSTAVMAVALAVAASDARTDRLVTRRTIVALAVAGLAFTIREPAGVAFVAIALARLWRNGRPGLRSAGPWALAVGLLGLGLLTFYVWRRGLSSGSAELAAHWNIHLLGYWWRSGWLFPLLGLMLAPVAALMGPLRTIRSALRANRAALALGWMAMPVAPILSGLGPVVVQPGLLRDDHTALLRALAPTFGNSFFSYKGFPEAGIARPYVPVYLSWTLGLVAVASTVVVVAGVVVGLDRWTRRPRSSSLDGGQRHYVAVQLGIVASGSVVVWMALIVSQRFMWDRYVLPGVTAAALLLLHVAQGEREEGDAPNRRWNRARLALAALAALSVVVTIAGMATRGANGVTATSSRGASRTRPAG